MGKIKNAELQSYTEYTAAWYVDDDGAEYEIVFVTTYDHNTGHDHREAVSVEKDGKMADADDPIWSRVDACVDAYPR